MIQTDMASSLAEGKEKYDLLLMGRFTYVVPLIASNRSQQICRQ